MRAAGEGIEYDRDLNGKVIVSRLNMDRLMINGYLRNTAKDLVGNNERLL